MHDLIDCSEDFMETFRVVTILSSNTGAAELNTAATLEHARKREILQQSVRIARTTIMSFVLAAAKIYLKHSPKTQDDLLMLAKHHTNDFEILVAAIRFLNRSRYRARKIIIDGVGILSHDAHVLDMNNVRKLVRAVTTKIEWISNDLTLTDVTKRLFWWGFQDFNSNCFSKFCKSRFYKSRKLSIDLLSR